MHCADNRNKAGCPDAEFDVSHNALRRGLINGIQRSADKVDAVVWNVMILLEETH